jgi:nucleoside-diphosphate-sugar epimerase
MEDFKGKSIVVTGAGGFIGSAIARRLVTLGARVYAVIRPSGDQSRLAEIVNDITIYEADVTNQSHMENVLSKSVPDGVFHLAAVSQRFGSVPSIDALIDTNIRATIKFMDAIAPSTFFVNTDTFAVVGAKQTPLRESDTFEPTELYGISRIPATLYGGVLGRMKGRPITTVRVFTPYGPFVQKEKLPYEVITHALSNAEIVLTRPEVTRDFIHTDDLVDLYLRAGMSAHKYPGHVFNGGGGRAVTLEEFANLVREETRSESMVRWSGTAVSYDSGRSAADLTKVRDLLGWQPSTPLREGIRKTIEWFRDHPDYWRS